MATHDVPVRLGGKIQPADIDVDTLADGTTKKLLTAAERTKLAGVATGATANASDAQLRDRGTHTGMQAADTITETTSVKLLTLAERTKLAGVATGATANATDAQLRDRSTHTGTQDASTIGSGTLSTARLPDLSNRYVSTTAAPICGEYQVTQSISNGTDTGVNTMVKRTLPAGVSLSVLSLRFGQHSSGSNGETEGGGGTVRCSVGLTATGPWFLTAVKGVRAFTVADGADVETDPLSIYIPAGGTFYTKTFFSPTSGTWLSQGGPVGVLGTDYWCSHSNGEADLSSNTAAFTATTGTRPYSPVAVIDHHTPRARPSVAIIGDSIAGGIGDTTNGGPGFILRALQGVLPYQRIAVSGTRIQHLVDMNSGRRRLTVNRGCTLGVDEYGTNDLYNATLRTLPQVQADKLALWTWKATQGCKMFATTLTPRTLSTDSWATTVNQSIANGTAEAVRIALNDWLRAGSPIDPTTKTAVAVGTPGALLAGTAGHPLVGYFEIADTVETARNSGLWKVDGTAGKYTADGTHPSTFGHTTMATGISTATMIAAVA